MKSRTAFLINLAKIIGITLTVFICCFTVSFYLVGCIDRAGRLASPFVYYLISSISGLFLGLTFIFIVTQIISRTSRNSESSNDFVELNPSLYRSIIITMEKITNGDFSVHLEHNFQENRQLRKQPDELVQSMNNMAMGLNQMENMRQEFVTNVSHEIQSPLMSINGFAQALKNENLSQEERQHYLSIIESESMRLSRLSENLIKLASLDSESVKFEPKIYRLDTQIKNIILVCEPQWLDKDIEIGICLDEERIKADEDLMSQVWLNLIHNSIKFTPKGGSVHIDMRRYANRIEVMITDTGIGISKEDQQRIFERFYKADKSRDRSVKGNGLGLAIVKKIVEMHRGSITVQSEPDKGSTFTIHLPVNF